MSTTADPQTAIDEQVVTHEGLERALNARQAAKEEKGAVMKRYRERDERVKALLEEQELDDGDVIRVGRFRITKRAVEARSVAFDTDPRSQLSIAVIPEA